MGGKTGGKFLSIAGAEDERVLRGGFEGALYRGGFEHAAPNVPERVPHPAEIIDQ